MKNLTGKIAFITGAANGIGRATALQFAREGAKVVLADIDVNGLQATLTAVRELGGEGICESVDVRHSDQIQKVIGKIIQTYGRLDFAHNNAGIEGRHARTADYTEEEWEQTISINLKSIWLCMKYEIIEMLKTGGGAIVNTSSIAGLAGFRKQAIYSASKHGIIGLTKSAALEYMKSGIRINAIAPGYIDTGMIERIVTGPEKASGFKGWIRQALKSASYSQIKKEQPSGRLGQADEIARAVVWLCSEESSFITGHVLPVDGGHLAR